MKSSVKDATFARIRGRALAALGVGGAAVWACKSGPATDGLVVAPMLETAIASSSATAEASDAAAPHRPTVDPREPRNMKCERQVECLPELAVAPAWSYAPPYERCDPTPVGEIGKFSPTETLVHRRTEAGTCCYVGFVACEAARPRNMLIRGRPLRDAVGEPVRARTIQRKGWGSEGDRSDPNDLLAAEWAAAGADEHASVAEFARLSLVLLGLGAPADLVADAHRAALDEIAHAEACFAIASRFAARALGPGPLEVARGDGDRSIAALVRSTLSDGCLGETAASIELASRADDEADEAIAAALATMAADEERHAELAWRVLRFACDAAPEESDAAIAAFLADAPPAGSLEREVLGEIVRPALEALRASATPRSPRGGDCAREA